MAKHTRESIGLIGIGLVGTALAENLLASGFGVIGYDIVENKRSKLEGLGGRAAASPREVASGTGRVILSLMDSEVVRKVVEGPGGLIRAEDLPRYIIDTTTGDPEKTEAIARRLLKQGVYYLDATISGSSEQIRNKEGVFMIGGPKEAFEACEDIFKVVAKMYFHIGPSGSGSKAKLASNLILGLNRLVLAEGLVFAEKLGLDLKGFLSLLKATPAYSCAMDVKGEKMIEGDFHPQSRILQHDKDLEIILRYAEKRGQELPLANLHKCILEDAISLGEGDLDTSAVIKGIKRLARKKT
jgi:3-hydroxyisobutyrate dehydrogenase-like beta-hydroxyacid dehydrogenase